MNVETRHRPPPQGKLAENIMHFARVLRDAGLPVGPGAVLDALDAAQCGALATRDDFYWMLHCIFVKRREHRVLFDQAFQLFWRKPKMLEQLMQMLFQQVRVESAKKPKSAGQRRLASAMFGDGSSRQGQENRQQNEVELESDFTASAREVLRTKDFEQMTLEEEARARAAIRHMRRHRVKVPLRRFAPSPRGTRLDMRKTIRSSLRSGGEIADLARRSRITREPPLVVLLDISGSMSNYSRMFLHFLHALTSDRDRVQVFVFGTRLTCITREIARRDVDEAMQKISVAVADWSGGTRIGHCLRAFNFQWARRVLGQGAHVLIMTDGLDRDDASELQAEMARLRRSAKRIVWLNPLLRYDGFAALAGGIRAMMPYVDEFRPVHNLQSLEDLAAAFAEKTDPAHDPRRWLEKENAA